MIAFQQVFDKLDLWRHLPAYQLERRADIFFSFYLKDVLEAFIREQGRDNIELSDLIIPEFPLIYSRGKLRKDRKPYSRSVKVDFVLFNRDLSKAYFIELKTDEGSKRNDQETYLKEAEGENFNDYLDGIVALTRDSGERKKYYHLLNLLETLGLLDISPDVKAKIYGDKRRRQGLKKLIESIKPVYADRKIPIEVFYVKPNDEDDDKAKLPVIDFDFFASCLEDRSDPLSMRFADSLRRWKAVKAGSLV